MYAWAVWNFVGMEMEGGGEIQAVRNRDGAMSERLGERPGDEGDKEEEEEDEGVMSKSLVVEPMGEVVDAEAVFVSKPKDIEKGDERSLSPTNGPIAMNLSNRSNE
jgi:hypothetical protein